MLIDIEIILEQLKYVVILKIFGTIRNFSSPAHTFSLKLIITILRMLDILFDRTEYRLHIIILHIKREPISIYLVFYLFNLVNYCKCTSPRHAYIECKIPHLQNICLPLAVFVM